MEFIFSVNFNFQKSNLLFKLIFSATEQRQMSEIDVFQKPLFLSLTLTRNLLLKAIPSAFCEESYFFY